MNKTDKLNAATFDIWWDDEGCWTEVPNPGLGNVVIGPFATEGEAETACTEAAA